MPYFRSYEKQRGTYTLYSYTAMEKDGTNPVKTAAIPINDPTFNYPLVIGNQVKYLDNMLRNCASFNQDIEIPNWVSSCQYMLYDCANYDNRNIRIKGLPNCRNMIKNSTPHIRIYANKNFSYTLVVSTGSSSSWHQVYNGVNDYYYYYGNVIFYPQFTNDF